VLSVLVAAANHTTSKVWGFSVLQAAAVKRPCFLLLLLLAQSIELYCTR
jgi:hypothetical protein